MAWRGNGQRGTPVQAIAVIILYAGVVEALPGQ